ncbi:MAG: Mrp/NBP35 family ATP-binding protein [Microbacteriaceae bacterium]
MTRFLSISSGKGGVGKSTITVNLAAALTSLGYRTAILDADIHGFSIPALMGLSGGNAPVLSKVNGMIQAPESFGIPIISIGMFLEKDEPVAWRGPMLHRTLEQFLGEVNFGEPDYVLLDLPPGTGDMIISIGQLLPQAQSIVVTTPQPSASTIAWRSASVMRKSGQEILGVIENMSAADIAGQRIDLFGSGGGEALSQQLSESTGTLVPLLGSVPLDPALRVSGDVGIPLVFEHPDSAAARELMAIAERIVALSPVR